MATYFEKPVIVHMCAGNDVFKCEDKRLSVEISYEKEVVYNYFTSASMI